MKVIIPMAGNGKRFAEQGYEDPKPFIDVNGKPMIRKVVESLNLPQHEHIFICKAEHIAYYDMDKIFSDIDFDIVVIPYTLPGAALSVTMAHLSLKDDDDILIVNSDQLLHYNSESVEIVRQSGVAGCIWCFKGNGPNWSYASIDENGYVDEVAEKKQISEYATGGMYYWKSFNNFVKCVDRMVLSKHTVNNEYYVAPVYNYMAEEEKVIIQMLDDVTQLGTPVELRLYEDKIRIHRNNQSL
jgi:NDP-sugar pyrophosphorylase family protein